MCFGIFKANNYVIYATNAKNSASVLGVNKLTDPMRRTLSCLASVGLVIGKVYFFLETFGEEWEGCWTVSNWKKSEGTQGSWFASTGKWFADEKEDVGFQITEDSREVYSKLPSGLTVRNPTSCPWSLNSVCSVVDLNKLHIDQSEPGRTDIKVSGETLTMKGSGNLDLWTRSRAGAPVAWLNAPTDDTYTFEVNCRLVLGGGTGSALSAAQASC